MTNFDCLPFDVIDYILNFDCISYIDVCRLASVSTIFNCISKSNKLWKKKYLNMWPKSASLYDAQDTDWRLEFRVRFDYKKLVFKKLSELSAEYYHHEHVTNEAFLYFKDIARNHPLGFDIIINELDDIINYSDSHLNLTHKYYAHRALRYMCHAKLQNSLEIFLSQPLSNSSLVEGICLISQWCQPTFPNCTSQVATQIEDIAKHVFKKVQQLFPKHPIVKQGLLKDNILSTSLWSVRQCKDILYCLNTVMFEDLEFSVNHNHDECDSAFVDKVLTKRSGISTVLGIIYLAVASKLGVACLPVNFPGYFLLKHPGMDEKDGYIFIDVFENGAFKKDDELNDLAPGLTCPPSWTEAAPIIKVFVRLAWHLVEFSRQMEAEDSLSLCNALELLCLLSPEDMEHKLLMARLYMHLGINITEALSLLQEIAAHESASELIVGCMYQSTLNILELQKISRPPVKKIKTRDMISCVRFAVGMIMKHKKYKFRCVIYGWDHTCTASDDWQKRMGVNKLSCRENQPFYYVLVDDGTNRYAAQENLEIDKECKPISHMKIGRYFESYHGSYYLPNEQTRSEYPEEIEERDEVLQHYFKQ